LSLVSFEDFYHAFSDEGLFNVDALVGKFVEGCSTKNLQMETQFLVKVLHKYANKLLFRYLEWEFASHLSPSLKEGDESLPIFLFIVA